MDDRPRILTRMKPAIRRLLRLEGQHAITLLFFGTWLLDSPPRLNPLPGWPVYAWALPMILIGLGQVAALLIAWYRGRVIAGMGNVLIWVAVTVGLTLADDAALVAAFLARFGVVLFGTFAFFAFWAFVAESFGKPRS